MAQSAEEFKISEPDVEFFHVRMVAYNGKFRGIRGALLHLASKHCGYRSPAIPAVRYGDTEDTSSHIYIDVYFREESVRRDFVNGVRKIHHIPRVLRKCFPDYRPTFEVETRSCTLRDSQLSPITDFELEEIHRHSPPGSIDYDCEVQSLGSYFENESRASSFEEPPHKRSASASSTTTVGRSSGKLSMSTRSSDSQALRKDDPLFTWQTLERNDIIGQPFKCHLIDKKLEVSVIGKKNDPNNYLAGSWPFHQLLDGLNLTIPHLVTGILVLFEREAGSTVKNNEGATRHKVFLRIKFLDDDHDDYMKDELRNRSKRGTGCGILDDGSARTYVHVLDVEEFRPSLEWKGVKTNKAWRLYKKGRFTTPTV